ncbi:MAG: hypothetical protein R3F59_24570 [Myxococcota bacterium]
MRVRCAALLGAVGLVAACRGPEGPAGPAGADGDPGLPGADGDPGPTGPAGGDGATGPTGASGQDGQDGVVPPGLHTGAGPWGLVFTLEDVEGGTGAQGQIEPGDLLTVVFRIEDDAGEPYDLGELAGLTLQLAGPTDHMQVVLSSADFGDVRAGAVFRADGTWAFDVPVPVPATFEPPANDTPDLGPADGDWGGLPLVDGTYTLGGYAYLRWTWSDGTSWTETSNATLDVLGGAATALAPHAAVTQEACAACHGEHLAAHGGPRDDVALCRVCHVEGAEDRASATDPTLTPGATIALSSMIHGIHSGAERPTPLVLAGYPSDPSAPGYPSYNLHDFGEVEFPAWPGGAAQCTVCHGDAPDGAVEERPAAVPCAGCHSDVDVRAGEGHAGGPQADDSQCALCHHADELLALHADPREDPAINPGLHVAVVDVLGGSGPNGALQPGDEVTVAFSAEHDDGTPVDLTALSLSEVILSGPTDHFQQALVSGFGTVPAAPYDAASGTYRYVLGTVPATYPPQPNDTADLGSPTATGAACRWWTAPTGWW